MAATNPYDELTLNGVDNVKDARIGEHCICGALPSSGKLDLTL
jgi:hypothetical protein